MAFKYRRTYVDVLANRKMHRSNCSSENALSQEISQLKAQITKTPTFEDRPKYFFSSNVLVILRASNFRIA